MFKDYYKILEVSPEATLAEIKQAYRYQSLKWHPDKNQDKDTTAIMLDINEAYSILKDAEKRQRYDREYNRFKQFQQTNSQRTNKQQANRQQTHQQNNTQTQSSHTYGRSSWTYDYTVHDEQVKNDMDDAREYARKLVDEFLKGLKENSAKAAKGAWEEMQGYVIAAIILTIIGLIIMASM